jgi:IS605 OrfB family transposase
VNHKRKTPDGTAARTACARALIRGGIDERTGEVVTARLLAARVGWCAALVSGMAGGLLASHWNARDVGALAGGVDAAGRPLPAAAWMALRRLGWAAKAPEGITVNDRIVRMAQEQAGRTLRSARWRKELTSAVLATWPADPQKRTKDEWEAVRGAMTGGGHRPFSVIKASTRQILRFAGDEGRLPTDLFELQGAPSAAPLLLLSACDRQQATIERSAADPGRVLLRLQLPVRPDPRSYRDWTWVACPLTLPPTVPAGALLHLPAVRVANRKIRADLAFTHAVPASRRAGHSVALGVDWGLNTLLSAGAARRNDDGTIMAVGSGAQDRAAGVLAKQHRLRRQGEALHAKASHYDRLIAGDQQHPLNARRAILAEELRQVSERRCNLNDALARSAARWTVDQAVAAGASVIYLEDLRSMEASGMGRTLNTRLSQTVRGKIARWIRHLAAEAGIAVVTVPARGTSRHCPRCLTPLRHTTAPDKPAQQGWKWAICPNPQCGWQGDRDQGAWQRIAARGLTHQQTTTTDRTSRTMTIRAINDDLEAAAVVTPQPARRGPKAGQARRTSARPAPRRRRAPSPARPPGRTGQRPEGHAPTVRHLPRAARRNQDVTTISTPTTRHQPRGAALGAGFHLHAHATPPRWEPEPASHHGSPRITKLIRDARYVTGSSVAARPCPN